MNMKVKIILEIGFVNYISKIQTTGEIMRLKVTVGVLICKKKINKSVLCECECSEN